MLVHNTCLQTYTGFVEIEKVKYNISAIRSSHHAIIISKIDYAYIQMYVSFDPIIHGDEEQAMTRLTACLAELRQWMLLHHLKLNDGKTEVIRFVSKHNANRLGDLVSCPVNIGNSTIVPKSRVRNLGVIMDQHLSMIDNVSAVCASCNYHLRRLSSIRRYLTQEATRCAVQAFITSRLDYCNSLLHDIGPTTGTN